MKLGLSHGIGSGYRAASNSPIAKALTDIGVISWFDMTDQDSVFTGSDFQNMSLAADTDPVVAVIDKAGLNGRTVAEHKADAANELNAYDASVWGYSGAAGRSFGANSVTLTNPSNSTMSHLFNAPGAAGWHLITFTLATANSGSVALYGQPSIVSNDLDWRHYRSSFSEFATSPAGLTYTILFKLDGGFRLSALTTEFTVSDVSVITFPGWSMGYESNTRMPSWTNDGSLLWDGVDDFLRIRDDVRGLYDSFFLTGAQYDVFIVMETTATSSPRTFSKTYSSESMLTWADSPSERTFRPYWVADANMPYHTGPGEPAPEMYINNVLQSFGSDVVDTIQAKAGARFVAEMRSPIFKPGNGDFIRIGDGFAGKWQAVLAFPVLTPEQRTIVYDTLYQLYGVTP